MKFLRIVGWVVIAYLMAAPLPIVVASAFDLRYGWHSGLHLFLFFSSMPVLIFAETFPILPLGRYVLVEYAFLYWAMLLVPAGVWRIWDARRAALAA